jgi:alpha-ketoglutarate-dependent taurine dioxygenase
MIRYALRTMETTVLDRHGGVIVPQRGCSLLELASDDVMAVLTREAAVLFRGFGADLAAMHALGERLPMRFGVHPNLKREVVSADASTLLVDPDFTEIAPHQELGYLPATPDYLWFLCLHPPAKGGETTIIDGARVFAALSPRMRSRFEQLRLRFKGRFPKPAWSRLFGVADRAELETALTPHGDVLSWQLTDDETLEYEYLVSAIEKAADGTPAFVNSLLVSGPHRGAPPCDFEDGSALESADRLELLMAVEKLSVLVRWQSGDLVVLDNRRMMHGRRAFKDPARKIAFRMAWANRATA